MNVTRLSFVSYLIILSSPIKQFHNSNWYHFIFIEPDWSATESYENGFSITITFVQ